MSPLEPIKPRMLSPRGQLILSAARELFLTHGFDGTSLDMIIDKSGGSRRSIYEEFGNKQGLLFAVFQEKVGMQVETLSHLDLNRTPKDNLVDACFMFIKRLTSPDMVALLKIALNMVDKLPKLGEIIYEGGPLTGIQHLVKYLTALNARGVLVIDDPEFAGQMLIEMCKGKLHIKAMLLPNASLTDDEIKEHVIKAVDLFLKTYQK